MYYGFINIPANPVTEHKMKLQGGQVSLFTMIDLLALSFEVLQQIVFNWDINNLNA